MIICVLEYRYFRIYYVDPKPKVNETITNNIICIHICLLSHVFAGKITRGVGYDGTASEESYVCDM